MMEFEYGIAITAKNDTAPAFQEAKREGEKSASALQKAADRAKKAWAGFGTGVDVAAKAAKVGFAAMATAAVAAVSGLIGLSVHASEAQDQIYLLGQRFGETAEWITSASAAAGSVAGTNLETFTAGIGDLAVKMAAQPAILAKWQVSATTATGAMAPMSEMLGRVADRVAKAQSAAERNAIAMELMGEAGRQMVPLLQGGREALEEMIAAAAEGGQAMATFEANAGNALATQLGVTKDTIEKTSGAIGAQLAPLLTVLAGKVQTVAAQVTQWVRTHQDLIEGGIQEFLAWMADSAIPALVTGVVLLTKAWNGWRMLIATIQQLVAAYYSMVLEGGGQILDLFASMASRLGADGVAGALKGAADAAHQMGEVLGEAADGYGEDAARLMGDQAKLEAQLGDLGVRGSAAVRAVAAQTATLTANLKEAQVAAAGAAAALPGADDAERKASIERLRRQREMIEAERAAEEARLEIVLENQARRQEIEDAFMEDRRAKIEALSATTQEMFSGIMSAGVEAFQGIGTEVNGQVKTWGDAFGQFFAKVGVMLLKHTAMWLMEKAKEAAMEQATAQTKVQAKAASAAAGAAESQSSIPVVGPALAVAAMTAIMAAVMGLTGGFNSGGIIGGTGPNRDSVLIRATPGEGMLDRETTAMVLRSLSGRGGPGAAPAPSAAQPSPRASASPSAMDRPIMLGMLAPPTNRVDLLRAYQTMDQDLAELRRTGGAIPTRRG